MLATMGSTCQRSAFCAVNEWRCLSDMEGEKRRKREGGGKVGIPNCRLYSDTGGEECLTSTSLISFEQWEACRQTTRGLPGHAIQGYGWLSLWVTGLSEVISSRLEIRGYVRECVEIKSLPTAGEKEREAY